MSNNSDWIDRDIADLQKALADPKAWQRERDRERKAEIQAAKQVQIRRWEEADRFDGGNYFRIPEFDVKPADVGFVGFEDPILCYWDVAITPAVRRLVRTARTMLRRSGVKTISAMYANLDEAWAVGDGALLSEAQRASLIYFVAVDHLRAFIGDGKDAGEVLYLAEAAGGIAAWALEGPAVALHDQLRNSQGFARLAAKEIGAKGLANRWANDPTQVVKPEIQTLWKEWQGGKSRFASQRAFASAMVDKFPVITDPGTVETWCRDWKKRRL